MTREKLKTLSENSEIRLLQCLRKNEEKSLQDSEKHGNGRSDDIDLNEQDIDSVGNISAEIENERITTREQYNERYERTLQALKKDNVRAYTFNIVTYCLDEGFIEPMLSRANHWVIAKHDRDNQDTHLHVLVTFPRNYSKATIYQKLLNHDANTTFSNINIVRTSDPAATLDYYTHKYHPEKAQYSPSEFKYSDQRYWQQRWQIFDSPSTKRTGDNDEFINDLLNLGHYEMARKYGRDYIKNHISYRDFARALQIEMGMAVPVYNEKSDVYRRYNNINDLQKDFEDMQKKAYLLEKTIKENEERILRQKKELLELQKTVGIGYYENET